MVPRLVFLPFTSPDAGEIYEKPAVIYLFFCIKSAASEKVIFGLAKSGVNSYCFPGRRCCSLVMFHVAIACKVHLTSTISQDAF